MSIPKTISGLFLACALIAAPGLGVAQGYPTQVVRIIVPFPAGGSTDTYARILAHELRTALDKSVIVENRAGATGAIGTQAVRQSAPDGYTLLFTSNTAHVFSPVMQNPRPFDPVADFTPVSVAVRFPQYLIVHPSVPVRSLKEFIAFAKARPGQLNYSSSGTGGYSHIVGEMLNAGAGIKTVHVPYKGAAPAMLAVVTGETHFKFDNIGISQPQVSTGKLRGLAVTGAARAPALPDVPTMAEAGLKGFEDVYTWLGLLGPAGLPPSVVSTLGEKIAHIMSLPAIRKRVLNDGYEAVGNTPQQFKDSIEAEVTAAVRLIRDVGIKQN
ncbi:MAG: tripartite tricarboxylate transporter substrate binding protein [Burkholderiales bacterium]|nr:tripartite tricarboxylate transporter substrate binding protein [Burkholderiales bacterium]